jgi:2-keto-4-pentenoate hydratase/2-oxohepta-3-ene-1,7-dioic acid hydratase in catechol pathway
LKIARFKTGEKCHYGIVEGETILSIAAFFPFIKLSSLQTIEELISLGPETVSIIEEALKDLRKETEKDFIYRLDEVELLAPLSNPPKIICLGLNYYDHAAEQGARIPEEPIIFMKPRTAITGPNKPIIKPQFVKQLDYEAELAIVIGKKGKNIPVEKAGQYIFGYTILNDVSARDIQFKDRQWTRGKSFDTFAPIGPYITTANQIEDPNNLRIRTWVDDELRQDSSTRNMVFNVYEIVHQISKVMTLELGDIIATGTPAGVGVFMKPEPKFLKPNNRITIEIEMIGKLENFVVEES